MPRRYRRCPVSGASSSFRAIFSRSDLRASAVIPYLFLSFSFALREVVVAVDLLEDSYSAVRTVKNTLKDKV